MASYVVVHLAYLRDANRRPDESRDLANRVSRRVVVCVSSTKVERRGISRGKRSREKIRGELVSVAARTRTTEVLGHTNV